MCVITIFGGGGGGGHCRRTMIICIHSRTIGIKIRRLDNTSPSPMISEKKNLVEFRRGKGLLTVHRPAYHLEALDRRERRENIVCDLSPPWMMINSRV